MERSNGVASTNHNNNRRRRYFTHCIPLHKAALKGDWEEAEKLLLDDPTLVRARITEGGLTALHIAAIEGKYYFVYKLIQRMDLPGDLEITSNKGVNALCFAAAAGNIDIVKLILRYHPSLAWSHGVDGGGDGGDGGNSDDVGSDGGSDAGGNGGDGFGRITPLSMAALLGQHETAGYLYDLSDFDSWDQNDQVALLTRCISTGMYGLAVKIVGRHRNLSVVANSDNETPLEMLARTPTVFSRHSSNIIKRVFWEITAKITSPFAKKMNTHKHKTDAYMLFDHLWKETIRKYEEDDDIEAAAETIIISSKLLFVAAESGNDEFLVEIISRYPDFLYTMNSLNHSIFHIAILNRNVRVFNLIYELNGTKVITAGYIDRDGNNMLHLAAKLAPQERLNAIAGGAALQMQQEVMWFKEVEEIVPPSYRTKRNSEGQTPHELFSLAHEKLMSEGEKQIKKLAKSFMVVTVVIPTLALTIAGMVPNNNNYNGNNKDGTTRIIHRTNFTSSVDFQIIVAVSLLSFVMSMLMFLHVMTCRCNDRFFLTSPLCLVCGVFAFFLSIGSMVVVFGLCPLFNNGGGTIAPVLLLTLLVVVVPVMIVFLGPLLVTILCSTFSSHLLFGSKNRLFS